MKRGEDPAIVVELKALRVSVATLQNALNNSQAQLAAKEQELANTKTAYSKQLDSQQTYHNQAATAWQQSEAAKNTSLVAKTQEVQTLTAQLAQKTAECQTLTTNLVNLKLASDAKDIVIATSKIEYKALEDKSAVENEMLKLQLKSSVVNVELMQKYVESLEKDKDILRDEVVDLVSSFKNFHKKDTHEVAQEVILDKSFSMNEHSNVEFLQSDVEIKVEDSVEVGVVLNISGQSDSFQDL